MNSKLVYSKEIQDQLDKIDVHIAKLYESLHSIESSTVTTISSKEFKAEMQLCYAEINQLLKEKQDILLRSCPSLQVSFESTDEKEEFERLVKEELHFSTS